MNKREPNVYLTHINKTLIKHIIKQHKNNCADHLINFATKKPNQPYKT